MAEGYADGGFTTQALKQKIKAASVTERVPLGVIDTNINVPKGSDSLKPHGTSIIQPNLGVKFPKGGQIIRIFEDKEKIVEKNEVPVSIIKAYLEYDSTIRSPNISPKVEKDDTLLLAELKDEEFCPKLVWCTPYRKDIYLYFRSIEKEFQPYAKYMEKQADITPNMRSILVDWLVEVAEEYKLKDETLYLAVSCTDRFLSTMTVLRTKLQLVGTASMFLTAKYEEIGPPDLKDFVYITDETYTKKQILKMEQLILRVLNFRLSGPTAYTFLQLYCSIYHPSQTAIHLSEYICELSLLDEDPFLKFLPSIVAAASLALANYTLGFDMWDKIAGKSIGYQLADLTYVIKCLYEKYSFVSKCPQQATCEKYMSTRFGCVATIPPPKHLVFVYKST